MSAEQAGTVGGPNDGPVVGPNVGRNMALWWNCFSGIAGDMALASLLDAGAELEEVLAGLRKLPVGGWELQAVRTDRAGLTATQVIVEAADDGSERTWGYLKGVVEGAGLPERARRRALAVFSALAAAEGHLHGLAPDEVHFHEVGSTDAVVDIVGTCLALESLGIRSVHASPVALGVGTVRSSHGALPNPAPAVLELLKGAPVTGTGESHELATPTGAALLAALAGSFGPVPPLTVTATGYGAGTRDIPGKPNVLQAVVGELTAPAAPPEGAVRQELLVLEANVDDVTGEVLAHTVSSLIASGALDAWVVPAVGKKGRPAQVVSALAEAARAPTLARVLLEETGALGYREHPVARTALPRRWVEVEVSGERVRVKLGPHRAKAEHDDCQRAALALGVPLREVARLAENLAAAQAG